MKNIRLSEKHGVNPTIPICFFCGKEKNELLLLGRLPNDVEAPKNIVYNKTPCNECIEYMKQGIILVSVKDGEKSDNPYRTGGWVVVREEAAKKIFDDDVIKSRFAFVEDTVFDMLGLPRE